MPPAVEAMASFIGPALDEIVPFLLDGKSDDEFYVMVGQLLGWIGRSLPPEVVYTVVAGHGALYQRCDTAQARTVADVMGIILERWRWAIDDASGVSDADPRAPGPDLRDGGDGRGQELAGSDAILRSPAAEGRSGSGRERHDEGGGPHVSGPDPAA
jgi:hypothetical protein